MENVNDTLIKNWCEGLAKRLLSNNIIDQESFEVIIYTYLRSEMDLFLRSMVSDLEGDIITLKRKASILHGTDSSKYYEVTYKLGILQNQQKKLNAYNTRFRQITGIKKLREFLKEKGYEHLVDEFYEQKREQMKKEGIEANDNIRT